MGIPVDSEGTPVQCQSANLPRSLEKVDFYEETLGFSFTNKDFTEEISELQINSRSRELYFDKIQDLEPDVSRKLLKYVGPMGLVGPEALVGPLGHLRPGKLVQKIL